MPESKEHSTKRWISYAEAQESVSLSRGTLWKLVESKRIPAARIGRRVLLDREGLDAYLTKLSRGHENQ